MKIKTIFCVALLVSFVPVYEAVAGTCIDKDNQPEEIATILANYTQHSTSKDETTGVYEICFDPGYIFGAEGGQKKNIEIIVPPEHTLKISGLRFPLFDQNNPLSMISRDAIFIIIGSNVIFDDVKLNGNGSGAAIQLYGTNITIKNSTISNFAEGIRVAANASVTLENNIFETIGSFTSDYSLIFDTSFISPIDSRLLGKKTSETDATKIETAIGKINAESCEGTVAILKLSITESKLYKNPTAICSISNVQEKDTKFVFVDGTEEVVKAGTCLFTCTNINEDTGSRAIFAYTSPDGKSYPLAPMPTKKFADLPNVITFTMPSETIPNGADGGGAIIIGDQADGTSSFNGNDENPITVGNVIQSGGEQSPKTSELGGGEAFVGQGAKASCTLVKTSNSAGFGIMSILSLLGILFPVGLRSRYMTAKNR